MKTNVKAFSHSQIKPIADDLHAYVNPFFTQINNHDPVYNSTASH